MAGVPCGIRVNLNEAGQLNYKTKSLKMTCGDAERIRVRFCHVALLMLLLYGCTVSHTDITLYQDRGFTYESLVAGGLAVGGVVSAVDRLEGEARIRYAEMLRKRIAERCPGLEIYRVEKVLDTTGEAYYPYVYVADEYRRTGNLSPVTLGILRKLVAVPRYIVLARIIENRVTEQRNEYTEDLEKLYEPIEDGKDKKGRVSHEVVVWVELSTTRNMTVEIDLFDISKKRRVLNTVIKDNATRYLKEGTVVDKNRHEKFINTLVQDAVGIFVEGMIQPPPPDEARLLDRIFRKFAMGLQAGEQEDDGSSGRRPE